MNWKGIGKKILHPPIWFMLPLAGISAVLLVLAFIREWHESPKAIAVYVLAFYTLSIWCVFLAVTLPKRYRKMKRKIYDNPLGNRYMTDVEFKVRISLYISLVINLGYAVFKLISGVYYSSFWIGAVAVYYVLLSIARFLLLRYMKTGKQDMITKYRRYRLTAMLMLFINLTLSVIVLNMIFRNESASYSDIYVITTAAYAFYMLITSFFDLIRHRKRRDPILSAAKTIRFTAALVSLLSLEASMLIQFGNDELFRKWMLSLTGIGVCVIIVSMSIYMMIRASREIERLRLEGSELYEYKK